jgi:hypothetical protein
MGGCHAFRPHDLSNDPNRDRRVAALRQPAARARPAAYPPAPSRHNFLILENIAAVNRPFGLSA